MDIIHSINIPSLYIHNRRRQENWKWIYCRHSVVTSEGSGIWIQVLHHGWGITCGHFKCPAPIRAPAVVWVCIRVKWHFISAHIWPLQSLQPVRVLLASDSFSDQQDGSEDFCGVWLLDCDGKRVALHCVLTRWPNKVINNTCFLCYCPSTTTTGDPQLEFLSVAWFLFMRVGCSDIPFR